MPPLTGLRKTGAHAKDFLNELLTQDTRKRFLFSGFWFLIPAWKNECEQQLVDALFQPAAFAGRDTQSA
jgi:hypothetical protein